MKPEIKAFFHKPTFTVTYLVTDPQTQKCLIIDSVLDFDAKSGRTSTAAADEIIAYIEENRSELVWILETHVHADHLTAAPYLQEKLGGVVCIGDNVAAVQKVFKGVFNTGDAMATDGSQFGRLLKDGDVLECGDLKIETLYTPGHTPACLSYVVEDAIFVGDTLFMPDFGTARCDFPGGDAAELYNSIRGILSRPDETRLFMCHDYAPGGRDYCWETTVAEQRKSNIHINEDVSEAQFVEMRSGRDKELDMPVLILPSVQVNMRAGAFPDVDDNGVSYLKIPLNAL
ncbi:MBL fold metallo-hydrolase [Alphaproteobacteria bacterium 46_93_T64]|nr:MBL fold metallo-hydrolase [Alphaproteobacteria bacterium 46_93_T64]